MLMYEPGRIQPLLRLITCQIIQYENNSMNEAEAGTEVVSRALASGLRTFS